MAQKVGNEGNGKNTPMAGENAFSYPLNKDDLIRAVQGELDKIRFAVIDNLEVEIGIHDTILDLADKIMTMLYCQDGEYCRFERALSWAYDLAKDIDNIAYNSKLYEVSGRAGAIADLILDYSLSSGELND